MTEKTKKKLQVSSINKNATDGLQYQEVSLVRSQPSVTIKDDGKGKKAFEVKAYADTLDEAVKQALKANKELEKKLENLLKNN